MIEDKGIQVIGGLGVAWFVIGLVLITSGSGAGWVFSILGLSYLVGTMGPGKSLANEYPKLLRWVIVGFTALVLLIAIAAWIQ